MQPTILLSLSILLFGASGCASAPKLDPIDNALLVEVSAEGRDAVTRTRTARDAANDAYAAAQYESRKAAEEVEIARAALKTIRSQLDESKLAVELAESAGTPAELAKAQSKHTFARARADHARERLAHEKRALELADLREELALERHRLSLAEVELKKAEVLQGVNLVAAQEIPIGDYRTQCDYHRAEVETASERVHAAEERLQEARERLDEAARVMKPLDPAD